MPKVGTEATLREGVNLLHLIARNQIQQFKDWKTIQEIVRQGLAPDFFEIGDQLMVKWTLGETEYTIPWDVVDIAPAELEDGSIVPGLWIEQHYAGEAVQFDQNEAFYVVGAGGLPAGTYHITMANAWGTNVVSGKSYQFTLAESYAEGAQLQLGKASSEVSALPDTAPAQWRVRTYANASTREATEILELTEGTGGTLLGSLSSSTKYDDGDLNNMQRAAYGYNRWAQCAARQYYNSAAPVGEWYKSQNKYDRPPDQLYTLPGFMAGFEPDFLDVVGKVKVVTALNTVSDSTIGTTETTFDRFFLPSLEQEYIVPQLAGAEGSYWPYWKDRLGLSSPQAQGSGGTNANHIRYAYNAQTSPQTCRLRSAYRGGAGHAWSVTSTGYATHYTATYACRGCPACVIC